MCNNSTVFQSLNSTQEQCTTIALTRGITILLFSIVSTSLLLCLLLVLKRKAWNSPVKRLTLIPITFICATALVEASVILYYDILPGKWNKVFYFFTIYTDLSILSYLTVILAVLLFKIGAAIVPGEWKHKPKPRLLFLLEVMIHILILVLSLSFSAVVTFYLKRTELSDSVTHDIFYVTLVVLILGLFVIVFLLLYFHRKYSTTRGITRRAKWLLLEFSVLLVLLLTELVLLLSIYWTHKYCTALIVNELSIFVQLVIVLAIVVVVYLPDIHHHKYCKCFKAAPDQRPLLVNSGTQHTNPASVWDHANDPSYTVYSPPPEMTDCVTDTTCTLRL